MPSTTEQIRQLEAAIAAQESLRPQLGDEAVDAIVAAARAQLEALRAQPTATRAEQLLARYMPKALADKMRATGHVEGERKQVSVMFADLSGYTPLSERLDPEIVMNLSQDVLKELAEAVYAHEGYVAQFMGDAVMAVFGAPLVHEDDPERALHAALAMRERVGNLNRRWGEQLGQPLELHIGINTGLVVTGTVGSDLRMSYAVIGDTTNTAQRLQSAAPRGEILVSGETYRLTRNAFSFVALDPITVKGKREPVLAYRVLGVATQPGPKRGLETQGIHSPLVGREAERATLLTCVDRLLQGQGGIVSIIGEAGLGKSRLVAEIRRDAAMQRLYWLEGRTLSFGQTISYWPFQEILRQYADIREEDDEGEAWRKLETAIGALFPESTDEILPYLASVLALSVRGAYAERVKYLGGEAMGKQVFLSSRRFFERLARTQPTVLVFEDLHWMDESSVKLLEHLLPLVESVPLLIVGLSRPERNTPAARLREVSAHAYANRYSEINLAPLSAAASDQLLNNLLEIEGLPAPTRERIVSRSEGNPFFLEEVIRTLMDSGAVVRDAASGRWRALGQVETLSIPDTIQGVIMARVDRLDAQVKQLLRIASVVGRSFLYRVLRAIAEADQSLDEHLSELQQIELIREKQRIPELEYIFKHALAQEATYESILLQKRRELHARVAQVIETLFADRLEEFYGLLAYHYSRSESWEQAQAYLLKAGDQAGRIAADAEALAHYQQAMTAYARAFGDQWEPVQRAQLLRKMGEALVRRGEHSQALDYLRQGLAYLGRPLPASRWGERQATMSELARQIVHRLRRERLRQQPAPASPAAEEEARLYIALMWMAVVADSELFLMLALRLLNVSEQSGLQTWVIMSTSSLAIVADFISIFPLAERLHRRAVVQAEQLQHPDALGLAYQVLLLHEFYLGEWDSALEHGQRSTKAHREAGDLRGWGWATFLMDCILTYQGDHARAWADGEQLVRFGEDGADRQVWCLGLYVQGFVQQRRGNLEAAVAYQQQAIEMAAAVPDYLTRVGAGARLGECYLRQGELAKALTTLEASRRVSLVHKEPHHLATLRNVLAEASLLACEQSAKAERANWLKQAQRACRSALKQTRAYPPAKSVAMRLQGTYEWLRGNSAAAQKWWQRSRALAQATGVRYDLASVHLEMGRRLGERADLEKAEAIFAELGAQWDLAKAQALLNQPVADETVS